MMTRRTFTLGLSACLVGCGAGSSGQSPKVQAPSTQGPVPEEDVWVITGGGIAILTVEDGDYVLTDADTGVVRLRMGIDQMPGTHVVVDNTVTFYNGGQLPYAIIGDLS